METLAKEAGYTYKELVKAAREIKSDIEAKGEKDLPPPVFAAPSASPNPTPKTKKPLDKNKSKSVDKAQDKPK